MSSLFLRSKVRQRVPSSFSDGLVFGPVHEKGTCGFSHTLDKLLCKPRDPSDGAQAFACLAAAAFLADKSFSRSEATDRWTRDIRVSLPTSTQDASLLAPFEELLTFLSGDRWQLEGRDEKARIGARRFYKDKFVPDRISLFSGGTDSLVGAINALEEEHKVLLVSHFESGIDAGVQNGLVRQLQRQYGVERVRHRSIQLCVPNAVEKSSRSRSLLFLALGISAASVYGDDTPLLIPENGFVGLNLPLTGARLGSYSTRTTHPEFVRGLRRALEGLSVKNPIVNPLQSLSKGQSLSTCANRELLERLLPETVSCAKGNPGRYQGRDEKNCGYCYPCLMRRAAFHSLGVDVAKHYLEDAIGEPRTLGEDARGRDTRALLQAARYYAGSRRRLLAGLLKTGPISGAASVEECLGVAAVGYEEVAALVRDKGCRTVKRFA